jgi:hypothetical protein
VILMMSDKLQAVSIMGGMGTKVWKVVELYPFATAVAVIIVGAVIKFLFLLYRHRRKMRALVSSVSPHSLSTREKR